MTWVIIAGAMANAVRGGQWRWWLDVPENKLKWVGDKFLNALIYLVVVFMLFGRIDLAVLSFVAMWLGSIPGWGDYIGALGGWRNNDLREVRLIDRIILPLIFNPRKWGSAGLAIRGLFWGAMLALPFAYSGHYAVGIGMVFHAVMMPIVYWLALGWSKKRNANNWQETGWSLAELLYGAVLWGALCYV